MTLLDFRPAAVGACAPSADAHAVVAPVRRPLAAAPAASAAPALLTAPPTAGAPAYRVVHRATVRPFAGPQCISDAVPSPGERARASRVRTLIERYSLLAVKPDADALPMWLIEQAGLILDARPMRLPRHQAVVDVSGFACTWIQRFHPGPRARYAGEELKAVVAEELGELDRASSHGAHHHAGARPAFWTPAGLVVDEIRIGPDWDDVVDAWMARKLAASLTAGHALARMRGLTFLGVRILPLANPPRAVLARVAGAAGVATHAIQTERFGDLSALGGQGFVLSRLSELDLTGFPTGVAGLGVGGTRPGAPSTGAAMSNTARARTTSQTAGAASHRAHARGTAVAVAQ